MAHRENVAVGAAARRDPAISILRSTGWVIDGLAGIAAALAAVMVFLMALSIMYEIVVRTFFNAPTPWTLEYSTYSTIAVALLGAAYAAKMERHVSVDIIVCKLPLTNRRVLDLANYVVALFFVGLLIYSAQHLLSISLLTKAASAGTKTPLYIPQSLVLIGSVLLFLQLMKQIALKVRALVNGQANAASEPEALHGASGESSIGLFKNPAVVLALYTVIAAAGAFMMVRGTEGVRVVGLIITVLTILFAGTPIFLGVLVVASIGSFFLIPPGGLSSQIGLAQSGYGALDKFELAAIPLFILGGNLLAIGRLSDRLFDLFQKLTSRVPAPLAIASILSCAAFGAMSGSGISAALTIGIVAIPAMVARGYSRELAVGSVASAGTLAILIPPSIPMIVYASLTNVSVAQLFIGGVLPGLLITMLLCIFVYLLTRKDPRYRSARSYSTAEKLDALKSSLPVLIIPVALIVTIYSGAATPTEAAAAFVLYSLVLGVVYGEIRRSNFWKTLRDSTLVCSALLMILLTAGILNIIVTRLQAPQILLSSAVNADVPPWVIIVLINLGLIVAGMVFESAAITILLTPLLVPVIVALGYSPLWFGIILVINIELAQISPPVGIVLYAMQSALGKKMGMQMETVMKGALPFMIPLIIGLAIVSLYEPLSTWLPGLLLK